MIVVPANDLKRALPMGEAIAAMKRAYAAYSDGRAEVPLRTRFPISQHDGVTLLMPAYVQEDHADEALAVKIVSLFPGNVSRGFPLIHAAVVVLEADSGRLLAILEGSRLTAIRTGAASGAATDLLARPDSKVAAIFGAGVQGRTQLESICTVRPICAAWIYDSNPERARSLIDELAGRHPIPNDLRLASSPQEAIQDADIICTATTSTTPVFDDAGLKPGVHINGVGSYTPAMQEIPPDTVARARVVVDSRTACLEEAGDLIQPIRQGLISTEHIHAEIGEILLNRKPGKEDESQITFFKSVGIAVQDAVAARLALINAQKLGLGQIVNW
jgi:ornithine cyclodeaminase